MSDVFISYSRRNDKFAKRLIERLVRVDKAAWVDWEDLPKTSPNWWMEIRAGIESSDNFLFILSPESMASVVCNMELDYAIELKKRIVPILYQEVKSGDAFATIADYEPDEAMEERLAGKDPLAIARDNWQRISHINWVFFQESDDFDSAFNTLVATVNTDLPYVKAHTRYLTRAQEWQRENRRVDLLLFGSEIDRAEAWLKDADRYAQEAAAAKQNQKAAVVNPLADSLQREYIAVSRQAEKRRRRLARSAQVSIGVLAVAVIIGLYTTTQTALNASNAIALAETAQGQRDVFQTLIANADSTFVAIQPTLTQANAQIDRAIATVTQAAVVEDITVSFANMLLQFRDDAQQQVLQSDNLVSRYPEEPLAYQVRGLIYADQEAYQQAIADYTQALELNPRDASLYTSRGLASQNSGDHSQAIADFSQAIELNPTFALAFYNRGISYYSEGDTSKAIADFTQAIELDPASANAYYNRGISYQGQGDTSKAIADFTQVIALKPDDANAYQNRGLAYYGQEDYSQAITDFTQVIELDSTDSSAYYNRGLAYYSQGDISQAITDFTQAIELNPTDAAVYYNRGTALLEQGEASQAVDDFTKAIELNPTDGMSYYNRGIAYGRLENFEQALADFDEAISLGAFDAYLLRGFIYYLTEKDETALDDWAQYEERVGPLPEEYEAYRQELLELMDDDF